jgi:hypothetical protein
VWLTSCCCHQLQQQGQQQQQPQPEVDVFEQNSGGDPMFASGDNNSPDRTALNQASSSGSPDGGNGNGGNGDFDRDFFLGGDDDEEQGGGSAENAFERNPFCAKSHHFTKPGSGQT